MQICGTWVNALGLLLNLMGVLILLVFAGESAHPWKGSLQVYRFGLVLLFVGFLIQFLVALCPLMVG